VRASRLLVLTLALVVVVFVIERSSRARVFVGFRTSVISRPSDTSSLMTGVTGKRAFLHVSLALEANEPRGLAILLAQVEAVERIRVVEISDTLRVPELSFLRRGERRRVVESGARKGRGETRAEGIEAESCERMGIFMDTGTDDTESEAKGETTSARQARRVIEIKRIQKMLSVAWGMIWGLMVFEAS
jgi:hypothetical protein